MRKLPKAELGRQIHLEDFLQLKRKQLQDVGEDSLANVTTESVGMSEYDDDAVYNEEEFPYPTKLTRESFQATIEKYHDGDKVLLDKFMFENYRFITLDDLSSDLRALLKELDDELMNLINTDYHEFIVLGTSVEGSVELINNIKFDLNSYYNTLNKNKQSLQETDSYLNNVIEYKNNLHNLKKICSNLIVILNQIEIFNHLLQENSTNVRKLIGLFLSIHKNLKITCLFIRKNNLDDNNIEIIRTLINRTNLLKFEFKSYLEQVVENESVEDLDKLSAKTFREHLFQV